MSKGQRIGALAIAAIIAVAAVLLLRPGRDEGDATTQRTAAEPAPGQPSTKPGEQPAAKPQPEYTLIRMRDGKPVGSVENISVTKGDQVRLAFRSNAAGEIHIHGYDKYVDLEPDKVARVRFRANLDGIYEIEDHGTATQVAKLRVNPS